MVTVIKMIFNELPKKQDLEVRVLRDLLTYAEHQFGYRVEGISYRDRGNGDCMDNWTVEPVILSSIYSNIVSAYVRDESLSIVARNDLIFPYLEKQLYLLRPWSAYVDLDSTSLRGNLSGDQINYILMVLSRTEYDIAVIDSNRNHFDLAATCCQQALSHARLYEGEEGMKIILLCTA